MILRMSTVLQKNLRHQIAEKKVSVHALEKRAGLKPSAIHNILQGKSKRPAAEVLIAVAQELGCSVEDLVRENAGASTASSSAQKWSPDLYMNVFKTVQDIFNKKEIELKKSQVLEIVEEVYLYSVQGSLSVADKRFAEWLINRRISQKN